MKLKNHINTRPWILVAAITALGLLMLSLRIGMHIYADGAS